MNKLVSKNILITGITSFTGKYLEKLLLSQGYSVFGTTLFKSDNKNHFLCDLRNINEIKYIVEKIKPNYVFHFAGISFAAEKNRSLIYDVNVIGTENLLESIIKSKLCPKKILIASSATIYGNQNEKILNEKMCPKPVNHYGFSKMVMEQMTKTYFNKLNIIITRPFNYTGVGQSINFLIPKIVKHFNERKKIIELGNINVAREFNDITDISNIYYQLMLSNKINIIVNLCSGKAIYLSEIINYLNSLASYKIEIKINPDFVRENEIKTLKGSTTLLKSIIKYEFDYDIFDTLKNMYAFK